MRRISRAFDDTLGQSKRYQHLPMPGRCCTVSLQLFSSQSNTQLVTLLYSKVGQINQPLSDTRGDSMHPLCFLGLALLDYCDSLY